MLYPTAKGNYTSIRHTNYNIHAPPNGTSTYINLSQFQESNKPKHNNTG